MQLKSFNERLEYLRLYSDNPSNKDRGFMNEFYKSKAWLAMRDYIIKRDYACCLGVNNFYIEGPIIVHHINPVSKDDVLNHSDALLDPENLICVSYDVHNQIHYSKREDKLDWDRKPNDTKLW